MAAPYIFFENKPIGIGPARSPLWGTERCKTKLANFKEGHWLLVVINFFMINHVPVLTKEVLVFLAPQKNKNFIDATVGFGGHAKEILEKISPNGRLLAIDQDPMAIQVANKRLEKYLKRVDFANANFNQLGLLVRDWQIKRIDGILFDLGVSTYQLTSKDRGFSFNQDSVLDMRMSPN